MSSLGWEHFWENQKFSFSAIMKISTAFCAVEMEKFFRWKPTDKILDYGCGPAFLADYMATKNISITGADINKFYIEQSKKKHPESLFIHLTTDIDFNKQTLDKHLSGDKFDFIILLSISQYFDSEVELEKVIRMLLSHLDGNGKIILADVIDPKTSSLKDAISLMLHCFKKGQIIAFIKFMLYLIFSNYRKLSRRVKLLTLSQQSIRQIAYKNLLDCEKVNGLTIHSSRTSYVLSKKNNTAH